MIPAKSARSTTLSSPKLPPQACEPLILPMLVSRKSMANSDHNSSDLRRSSNSSNSNSHDLYKSLAHFTETSALPDIMPDEIIESTIWRDLQKIEKLFSENDDIYVLGVQEGINDTFFQLCEIILSTYGCVRLDLPGI